MLPQLWYFMQVFQTQLKRGFTSHVVIDVTFLFARVCPVGLLASSERIRDSHCGTPTLPRLEAPTHDHTICIFFKKTHEKFASWEVVGWYSFQLNCHAQLQVSS